MLVLGLAHIYGLGLFAPAVLVDEVLQRPEDLLERLAADLKALDLRRRGAVRRRE